MALRCANASRIVGFFARHTRKKLLLRPVVTSAAPTTRATAPELAGPLHAVNGIVRASREQGAVTKAVAPRARPALLRRRRCAAPEPCPAAGGRAKMQIEAAHGAAPAACATLPAASSYPRTLSRPCRAPGATLRRRKRLLQRQRDHIADIQPLIEVAEQHYCPGHHSRLALLPCVQYGSTYQV
eukprot:COSAG06_NODE_1070_length_10820_cov_4.675494_12_plen_184_part_00